MAFLVKVCQYYNDQEKIWFDLVSYKSFIKCSTCHVFCFFLPDSLVDVYASNLLLPTWAKQLSSYRPCNAL